MWVEHNPDDPEDSDKNEFRLGLWSAHRNTYSVMVFAYEDFFVRVVSKLLGEELRTSQRDFNKKIREAMGDKFIQSCWFHDKILIPRLVRNSIAHCGGRITPELEKVSEKHGFEVRGDRLQITPNKTFELFETIKDRTVRIMEWASKQGQF